MRLQIERLETEDAARKRRERRRNNEKKTRDIQRMQLSMTTPMDLGLERQDGLDDNEEDFMFDLNEVEGYGNKKKRVRLQGNEADLSSDEEAIDDAEMDSDDEALDTEDEEEAKLRDLEENLDDLYDQYQNHKLEKDARHKVKEARKKRDAQEGGAEWGGIKDQSRKGGEGGDEVEEDEEDSDDGLDEADTMAYMEDDGNTIPADELDSSDEEEADRDSDVENRAPAASKKRTRDGNLIQDLKAPKKPLELTAKSRAAAMWFDQPVFKDIEGLDEIMKAEAPAAKKAKEVAAVASTQEVNRHSKWPFSSLGLTSLLTRVYPVQDFALAPKKRKGKHVQTNPNLWDEEEEEVVSKEEANAQRIAGEWFLRCVPKAARAGLTKDFCALQSTA